MDSTAGVLASASIASNSSGGIDFPEGASPMAVCEFGVSPAGLVVIGFASRAV